MKKVLLHIIALLFIATLSDASANDSEIEILIDTSGSMAEVISWETKLDIAKQAVTTVINGLDDDQKIWLRSFWETCESSKIHFPIAKINKSFFLSRVDKLVAKWNTPIDLSLQKAANDFSDNTDVTKSLIFISDGQETCGWNPCETVKAIRAKGLDLTVHTIGFNVDAKTETELRCIADASGGSYLSASSADDLVNSLETLTAISSQGAYESVGVTCPIAGNNIASAPEVTGDVFCEGGLIAWDHIFYKVNLEKGQPYDFVFDYKIQDKKWASYIDIQIQDKFKRKIVWDREYASYKKNWILSLSTESFKSKSGEYYLSIEVTRQGSSDRGDSTFNYELNMSGLDDANEIQQTNTWNQSNSTNTISEVELAQFNIKKDKLLYMAEIILGKDDQTYKGLVNIPEYILTDDSIDDKIEYLEKTFRLNWVTEEKFLEATGVSPENASGGIIQVDEIGVDEADNENALDTDITITTTVSEDKSVANITEFKTKDAQAMLDIISKLIESNDIDNLNNLLSPSISSDIKKSIQESYSAGNIEFSQELLSVESAGKNKYKLTASYDMKKEVGWSKSSISGLSKYYIIEQLDETTWVITDTNLGSNKVPGWLKWIFGGLALILILPMILWLWALINCIKNDRKNKLMWILVIIFVPFGFVIYFIFGRKNEEVSDGTPEMHTGM